MTTIIVSVDAIPADDDAWEQHVRAVLNGTAPDREPDARTLAALRDGYPGAGLTRSWARATMHPARVVWTAWRDAAHEPPTQADAAMFATPKPRRTA